MNYGGTNTGEKSTSELTFSGAPLCGSSSGVASLFEEIDRVAGEKDELEEGEPSPSRETVESLKSLIADTSRYLANEIPPGHVATFYGELSITWRRGDRMVRLASFPHTGQGCRIDCGSSAPGPLGEYSATRNVTASRLAAELTDLFAAPADTSTFIDG